MQPRFDACFQTTLCLCAVLRMSLDVSLLLNKLRRIDNWHMLGVHLGIDSSELNKIRQQFMLAEGVERCKAEMLDTWLRGNPTATLNDVATALEKLDEHTLASDLRTTLCRPSTPVSPPTSSDDDTQEQDPLEELETVKVGVKKVTVRKFTKLEREFASLVCDVKNTVEDKRVDPKKLYEFLQVRLNQKIDYHPNTTISDLFQCITPYYCFLNTTLLEDIIDRYELREPLQHQLDEYEDHLEEFTSSTEVSDLKEIITQKHTEGNPLVVLKLAGRCLTVTIKRFQQLTNYIFGAESSALTNIQVRDGCICIIWITRESAIPALVALAKEKVEFMKHVGVLRLMVGENIILRQERKEEEGVDKDNLNCLLVRAVNSDCTEAVTFLLTVGGDPNLYSNGMSLLCLASMNGYTETVKLLIEAGADVNLVGYFELTPLMLACLHCHEDTVSLLLQSGADPSLQTNIGATALMYSICNNKYFSIVRLLLKAGAVVNAQDKDGYSALTMACRDGCYKLAELLIQYGADVQLSTVQHSSPLIIACKNGHEDIAALLLTSQADPNQQDSNGFTALMKASQLQLTQAISLLLSSGADPNLQSNRGQTALSAAMSSFNCDDSVSLLLLSAGADPNLQDYVGSTALMKAAHCEYVSGVRILLNAQAHVNLQNSYGYTALHYSSSGGNLAITELLLSAGANSALLTIDNQKALDLALASEHAEVCQLLLMHTDTTPHMPLEMAATIQSHSATQEMVKQQDTSSLSTSSPSHQLEQLRKALRHPLPPAGTSKHEEEEEEDEFEETLVKRYH